MLQQQTGIVVLYHCSVRFANFHSNIHQRQSARCSCKLCYLINQYLWNPSKYIGFLWFLAVHGNEMGGNTINQMIHLHLCLLEPRLVRRWVVIAECAQEFKPLSLLVVIKQHQHTVLCFQSSIHWLQWNKFQEQWTIDWHEIIVILIGSVGSNITRNPKPS